MSEILDRCSVCQAMLDEEDLFCPNCGTEAPGHADASSQGGEQGDKSLIATHNFDCQGCGASMSYDASAQTLRCPFCGSEKLEEKQNTKTISPRRVVPFVVHRDAATMSLRGWLQKGIWRPGDLSTAAIVTKMTPVFVPYWVFSAHATCYWTADSNQTPFGARGDWLPLTGNHRGEYHGLLVGASGALTPAETSALCPFDLGPGVPPDQVDLENVVFEQFRVQRKYARPLARYGFESRIRQDCAKYVPGSSRNLKVNVQLTGLTSEAVLLPVWIMAYRYQDQVFRFLLNGQTGMATGQAPTSWRKIATVVGVVILCIVVGAILIGLLSARS